MQPSNTSEGPQANAKRLCAGAAGGKCVESTGRPNRDSCVCVCVCLLLYLLQSCSRGGGRGIVEDMCYERRRAEACVD
jgi:hypothetical protein